MPAPRKMDVPRGILNIYFMPEKQNLDVLSTFCIHKYSRLDVIQNPGLNCEIVLYTEIIIIKRWFVRRHNMSADITRAPDTQYITF